MSSNTNLNFANLSVIDTADDQRSLTKSLIRHTMRTFYVIPKSLILEYIYHHEPIKQQDLIDRLCLHKKQVLAYIQEFKRDRFIIEEHGRELDLESSNSENVDQCYYRIDSTTFINTVKYRLENMRTAVEDFERQEICKQTNYKCEKCLKEYTELEIGILLQYNREEDLICTVCPGILHDQIKTDASVVNMILFNEQMSPLFQILKRIE
jgi:transcription initiation factor IIE alpha subunit